MYVLYEPEGRVDLLRVVFSSAMKRLLEAINVECSGIPALSL